MATEITLGDTVPRLSIQLIRGEERFLYLCFHSKALKTGEELICCLNQIEAFSLWNFLDEALEIPLNFTRK